MKKVIDDERLMVKICDMYYNQDLNQKVISAQLGLSRPTVSRIISNGKERGIVKIIIDNLEGTDYVELEREIEKRYGLREVIVVGERKDVEDQKNEIGKAAAQYLERVVKDNHVVGVSMGTTLGYIARYITEKSAKNVTFVPLIGGMGHLRMELHSNYLVEDLAKVFEGHFMLMHAPARVSGRQIKEELLKEDGISKIIKMGDQLDIAIVGIGVPSSTSAIMATGYYNRIEMDKMREKNVAGDICMQFYDINGSTTPFKIDNNVVGIEIKKLRRVPHAIGIACGIEKIDAIKGAINGKYINTLVTDIRCGQALVED
ncbi:MAG: sugar-binding transcriptional regulator [Eubacterium sp.]